MMRRQEVSPFIDEHVHGGMGFEVTSDDSKATGIFAEPSWEGCVLRLDNADLPRKNWRDLGTSSLRKAEGQSGWPHLEGPYINPECAGPIRLSPQGRHANQAPECDFSRGVVTYARDGGNLDFTGELCAAGIKAAAGIPMPLCQFKEA
jgi:hypothetical protein